MSFFGGKPKKPKVPDIEPPKDPEKAPREDDPEVQEATGEAVRRRGRARGFRSTILSQRMVADTGETQLKTTLGS